MKNKKVEATDVSLSEAYVLVTSAKRGTQLA